MAGTRVRLNGDDYKLHAAAHAAGGIDAVAGAGGGGYSVVQDEGAAQIARAILNFVGTGVTVTDDGTRTVITIPGGTGIPAGSVVSETTYGQAPAVGSSTNYARQDHTHGTPLDPDMADFTTQLDYDGSGNLIYLGRAQPATSTAAAAWQIKRFTYTSGNLVAVEFAGGAATFASAWTNRASLSYS